ncbi:MAG TPA: A/G-specific adenine glycosylase [Bryobacteraceae bacterium]|nr:A/G-specific adenine glycosylase [Bryobacteraceae bacterium]
MTARLTAWYGAAKRDLPWRKTRDPYRILVSEVMLQQTRSGTVIPYYEKFIERYPTAQELARAGDTELLRMWSGLGYYRRARNLREAARRIAEDGEFPSGYEQILELPGVGGYTAAAVGSIAFGICRPVIDGNVLRVIARLTADSSDIGAPATRAAFETVAAGLLDRRDPGGFNQAIMELGATVCRPRNPLCPECPVSQDCLARQRGIQAQLPVKRRPAAQIPVELRLLVIERAGKLLLWKREEDAGRLAGFWELPTSAQLPKVKESRVVGSFRHSITNHRYTITVVEAGLDRPPRPFQWLERTRLDFEPLSTTARKALATFGQRPGKDL